MIDQGAPDGRNRVVVERFRQIDAADLRPQGSEENDLQRVDGHAQTVPVVKWAA